jgi:hypothetical protein
MKDTPEHPDYAGSDADGVRTPDEGRPGDPDRPSPRKPSQAGYGHDSRPANREEGEKLREGERRGGFDDQKG